MILIPLRRLRFVMTVLGLAAVLMTDISVLAQSQGNRRSLVRKPMTRQQLREMYGKQDLTAAMHRRQNQQNFGLPRPMGEQVVGGTYIPGFGVPLKPEPVQGGMWTPGFGVQNGALYGGPNTAWEPVQGGNFMPGYGVIGSPTVRVQGGTYMPGFGVMGGGGGLSPTGGNLGTSVRGGSLVPGYGVVPRR